MILSLDYSDLSRLIRTTNKLSDELNQYCDSLCTQVQNKLHEVEGGMSSSLNNADYYVKSKIGKIREKESNANDLVTKTEALLETAKTVDANVEQTIKNNQTAFFKKNSHLRPADHKVFLHSLWAGAKNLPLIGLLLENCEVQFEAISKLQDEIRYWWECEGGEIYVKNILDVVVKVTVFALAVVAVVLAGSTLVLVAASIAAIIAGMNAITNLGTSVASILAYNDGDLAMSAIQQDRDTISSLLKESNFHNKFWNNTSNTAATVITITDQICGTILLVKSVGKASVDIMSKNGVGYAFKETASTSGKLTIQSFWQGTKAMVLNKNLTTSTGPGLRTTLIQNVKGSIGSFRTTIATREGWKTVAQTGGTAFVDKVKETYVMSKSVIENGDKVAKFTEFGKAFKLADYTLNTINTGTDALANVDGSGKGFAAYHNNTLYTLNDYGTVVEDTGIASLLSKLDKTNTINGYLAPKDIISEEFRNIFKGGTNKPSLAN